MVKRGFADVVVGMQFGDEGKGKLIAYLVESGLYTVVARYNGGSNAGHSVYHRGRKFGFHQLPSGVFCPNVYMHTGAKVVTNPVGYSREIRKVKQAEIEFGENFNLDNRITISGQSTVVQPHHIILDGLRGKIVATTGNGIGPAYVDQVARMDGDTLLNIRMIDLKHDPEKYFRLIRENLERVVDHYNVKDPRDRDKPVEEQNTYPVGEKMKEFVESVEDIIGFVVDDPLHIHRYLEKGSNVLFEGANGALLDRVIGTVPYVTSSCTTPGGAFTAELPPNDRRYTYGVIKIIPSRVGNGSFIGEFGGEESEIYCMEDGGARYNRDEEARMFNLEEDLTSGDPLRVGRALRIIGDEYGTTTGRPRRIGSPDFVLNTFSAKMLGVDRLVVTKADLLRDFFRTREGTIPAVVEYFLDGRTIDYLPSTEEDARRVLTRIENFKAFDADISGIRNYREAPDELRNFLDAMIGRMPERTKLFGIGVGHDTEQFALVK